MSGAVNVTDDSHFTQTRFILSGCKSLVLSVVGIGTNVVNWMVFRLQGLKDRMNLCLFFLAMIDIAYSATAFANSLTTILCHLGIYGLGEEHYQRNVEYVTGIMYSFRTSSGLYTMVIAVERCLCVMFPLHVATLLTTRTLGILLTSIAGIMQVGFITIPVKYSVMSTTVDGIVYWQLVPSKLYFNYKFFIDIILDNILSISMPLVTFILVSIATAITVVKLRAAMTWRLKVTSSSAVNSTQQSTLTVMLVIVSCAYIISVIPFVMVIVVSLVETEFSVGGVYGNLFVACQNTVNLFPLMNISVNFFVYYCRSSRFKHDVKCLFS